MKNLVLYRDAANSWRGKTVADNGRIMVATTQGYDNKKDCVDALIKSAAIILGDLNIKVEPSKGNTYVDRFLSIFQCK
tara:strand:- start:4366 stop:4599 length:234 start_codon:yes stop_codon:yes gene_type:complete